MAIWLFPAPRAQKAFEIKRNFELIDSYEPSPIEMKIMDEVRDRLARRVLDLFRDGLTNTLKVIQSILNRQKQVVTGQKVKLFANR